MLSIICIGHPIKQDHSLKGGNGEDDENNGGSDDQAGFHHGVSMGLGRHLFGLFGRFGTVSPKDIEETAPDCAEKKDGDPDGEHEDIVLVLCHESLGVEGRLFVVNAGATTSEHEEGTDHEVPEGEEFW